MSIELLIIVSIVLSLLLLGSSLPKTYRVRVCEGRAWKKRFPSRSKSEIRDFLTLFVNAFAFKEKDRLKFHPDDRLLDIYRELYPYKWQADAMEFETLDMELQKNYNMSLKNVWHDDLTLGGLFGKVQNA